MIKMWTAIFLITAGPILVIWLAIKNMNHEIPNADPFMVLVIIIGILAIAYGLTQRSRGH